MTAEESLVLSPSEKDAEFHYRLQERLGLLRGDAADPTKWEYWQAREECFKWLEDAEKARCQNIQQRE